MDDKNITVSIFRISTDSEFLDMIFECPNNYHFTFENSIFKFLKYKLLIEGEKINNVLDVSEGIDNKILKEINNCQNINELILKVKSKRYTYTRISRILLSFFMLSSH